MTEKNMINNIQSELQEGMSLKFGLEYSQVGA